ncbi:MAG TPA: STAS/SEC14 domain-containing protein [Labilithrix sp.]|jgi:hypothetical protein|nr:STAS/SEC14 domain-containing protein [Labilithrix sp.]
MITQIQAAESKNAKVWYEAETGFICVVQVGQMEEADAILIMNTIESYLSNHLGRTEPYYILVDIRKATGVSPSARRAFADSRKASAAAQANEGPRHIAIFGGSFAFRTFANLLMSALRLAQLASFAKPDQPGTQEWTVEADEAAARDWLAGQRRIHLARSAKAA